MGELAKIDSFRKELALAETIEEMQLLRDAGEAYQKVIQKNKGIAKSKVDEIGEYLIEVEEKEADWLNQFYPHGGDKPSESDPKFEVTKKESSKMPVPSKESARARKLKRVKEENPELYEQAKENIKSSEEVLNPKTLYKEIRKEENIQNRNKVKEEHNTDLKLSGKKEYRIIYADPPWMYNKGKELSDKYGDVQKHYPPMKIEDICNLPVKTLLAEDCVLFLWVTAPKLPEGLEVLKAWGFDYKTCIIWDKIKHNFGYYFSVRHEILLIGGIGRSTPDIKDLHDSVISIERSDKHSEKPKYFRELIDTLYTHGDRIELFAREKIDGWDSWGDEL